MAHTKVDRYAQFGRINQTFDTGFAVPIVASTDVSIAPGKHVFKFVVGVGLTQNIQNMNVNATGMTPSVFQYEVPANKVLVARKINFILTDAAFTPIKFGGIAALANGVKVTVTDGSDVELLDFLDTLTIKNNIEFGLLAGANINIGSALDGMTVGWTLSDTGHGLILTEGEKIKVSIQDDLTGLTEFRAMVQGVLYDES